MSKVAFIKNQPCLLEWGQFPTLISKNPKEAGKLMGNKAHAFKERGKAEKYALQEQERKILKQTIKETPKTKMQIIAKGVGAIADLVIS